MKLAAVMAARNEGALIEDSVRSVLKSLPGGVELHVVADRCEDDTAARAAAAGARVSERRDGPPGKAAALAWFVEPAADRLHDVDALLVLDADSRLRPGSMERLERPLSEGAAAAQAFVLPVPDLSSPASLGAAYSEWLAQAAGDRLRRRLGWPVPLRGTGMAVRLALFRELAPRLKTRVEDAELTLLLLDRRERIAFVPEAVVEDPKPARARGAARQRARWLQGQMELLRSYAGTLLRLLFTRGPATWSLLGTLVARPKTLFWLAHGILLLALLPWRHEPAARAAMAVVGISLGLRWLFYAAGLPFAPRAWRLRLAGLFAFAPLYLLVWVWAAFLGLFSRETWLRARD